MSDIKASDARMLGERIDLLESRLTFQDEIIDTLNKTITEQWQKIDVLTRQLKALGERLQEAEARTSDTANEPPPHY
jgi:SlyX protein